MWEGEVGAGHVQASELQGETLFLFYNLSASSAWLSSPASGRDMKYESRQFSRIKPAYVLYGLNRNKKIRALFPGCQPAFILSPWFL